MASMCVSEYVFYFALLVVKGTVCTTGHMFSFVLGGLSKWKVGGLQGNQQENRLLLGGKQQENRHMAMGQNHWYHSGVGTTHFSLFGHGFRV